MSDGRRPEGEINVKEVLNLFFLDSSRMGKIEDSKEDQRDVIRRREREKKRK